MTIKHGVIWTRANGVPQPLANITVLDDRVVFDISIATDNSPPLSLIWPWADIKQRIEYRRTANLPLPPFMMSHIPPTHRSWKMPNLQRRFLETIIGQYDNAPPPGFDTEWEMLMLGGRNGIGHLDFFRHDDEAKTWYKQLTNTPIWQHGRSDLWHGIHEKIESALPENETKITFNSLIGPTPSIGGMIPKLLLTIPPLATHEAWDGSFCSNALLENTLAHHVVAKIETQDYLGLVALEALCLDIHKEAGLPTPNYWTLETNEGLRVLAVERFDRQNGRPLLLESAFNILHLSQNTVSQTHGMLDMLGQAINSPQLRISHFPMQDSIAAYKRLVLALLTGNGDLHWDNWSFLQHKDRVGLSPVYDPAPMRAYPQHNLLMVMPFAGITLNKSIIPSHIGSRLLQMGSKAFGIPPNEVRDILQQLLACTESYPDRISLLAHQKKVPIEIADNLITIQRALRQFMLLK